MKYSRISNGLYQEENGLDFVLAYFHRDDTDLIDRIVSLLNGAEEPKPPADPPAPAIPKAAPVGEPQSFGCGPAKPEPSSETTRFQGPFAMKIETCAICGIDKTVPPSQSVNAELLEAAEALIGCVTRYPRLEAAITKAKSLPPTRPLPSREEFGEKLSLLIGASVAYDYPQVSTHRQALVELVFGKEGGK